MFKGNVKKKVLERSKNLKDKEKPNQSFISKHLKKVYPLGIHKSGSSVSLPSLSSSHNSTDSSSLKGPVITTVAVAKLSLPVKKEKPVQVSNVEIKDCSDLGPKDLKKRCPWITNRSDESHVLFHDEVWGMPVYEDNQLFEMLAFSGMLMHHLCAEIVKRKEKYREVFGRFNPNVVAKMDEQEIKDIYSNKELILPESQVRCIVDNARCILQIVKEFGSFGEYLWGYMNYRPTINRYRYPKSVPLRSPKAEAISRDLIRRGFRFAGPVIVYSFMQAAGMTIDHLVDCFRYNECVSLAEKRHGHG